MRLPHIIVAAALAAGTLAANAPSAFACSCIGVETREYLRSADIVYTGEVVDLRPDSHRPEIEFRLDRAIKGATGGDRFVLVTPPTRGVDCRGYDFVVGRSYLVFASARDSGASLPGSVGVNWCGGTVSLESDEGKARLREALDAAQPRFLNIYVVDVEGGNATLVVAPSGESLLIDTGNLNGAARDAERIMAAVKDAGVRQIDHLIITHWHADHFGGVAELAGRIPIRHFIDHGLNVQPNPTVDEFLKTTYPQLYGRSTHTVAKAGDKIGVGLEVRVVSSAGQVLSAPLPGAGGSNPYCASFKPGDNNAEDPQSVVTHITFGKFRALHPGDLTKNKEFELMCPRNRLGAVDVLLGLHHGQDTSNSEVLVHALRPRVAVMNNGTRKGGVPEVMKIVHSSPGLEDLWQLHFSVLSGQEYTVPGLFIANGVDEQPAAMPIAPVPLSQPADNAPPPPAHNGPAHWIKISAQEDGTFTVTNSRNGFSKAYRMP